MIREILHPIRLFQPPVYSGLEIFWLPSTMTGSTLQPHMLAVGASSKGAHGQSAALE